MLSVIRMYPSEDQAREAIRLLEKEEVAGNDVHLLSPVAGNEAHIVKNAIAHGQVPSSHIHVLTRALQKGNCVLSVKPPFVRGSVAEAIMQSCGAVDTDQLPEYRVYNPTPLSDILGIPALAKHKYTFNMKMLTTPKSKTSSFGFPLLSKAKSKTSSFGIPLLSKGKSKNSSFGIPLLSKPKSKNSSFGFPLLSKPKKSTRSMSHNPAPLSNLFNIPVLSKRDDD